MLIENLLCISKDLLHSLDLADFTEIERNYIIGVVEKILDVLLIECSFLKEFDHF